MGNAIKRTLNILSSVLVTAAVVLAFFLWGFRLFGMEAFVVQSGSMEPEYHVGSLIYTKETDAAELELRDVITFNLGNGINATHRIVEIVEEDGQLGFVTKGDANDFADNGLVRPEAIVGKVMFTVPLLGYLANYIQTPSGTFAMVVFVAATLLLIILPDFIWSDKKTSGKQEDIK